MEEDAALFLPDGTLLAHARQLAILIRLERCGSTTRATDRRARRCNLY
jgi:hypothetical protein